MTNTSLSKEEQLGILQRLLEALEEQYKSCSWDDFEVVDVQEDIRTVKQKISLLKARHKP